MYQKRKENKLYTGTIITQQTKKIKKIQEKANVIELYTSTLTAQAEEIPKILINKKLIIC